MSILPCELTLSTHAAERMVHRFKLSTSSLIKILNHKAYIAIDQEQGNTYILVWSPQDKAYIVLVLSINNGVILTVWNEQIYHRITGKRITRRTKKRLHTIYVQHSSLQNSLKIVPLNPQFQKQDSPYIVLVYLDCRLDQIKRLNLGRISSKLCSFIFKSPQHFDPLGLVENHSFARWLKERLTRSNILEKDIIGVSMNAKNMLPVTMLYNYASGFNLQGKVCRLNDIND